jgi:glycosyltransferase involved in cell wall biosynthesis
MGLLKELPVSSENKKGWPWQEEIQPEVYSYKNNWPTISIVVPSYNQGRFLEETLRSILLQNYPSIELIIIDGGSKDETVDIIKKYEPWIACWVSEKDRGQSDAINKGFSRVTGDIVTWLCSDDLYTAGTLKRVAEVLF